jgi:hypothetical protein
MRTPEGRRRTQEIQQVHRSPELMAEREQEIRADLTRHTLECSLCSRREDVTALLEMIDAMRGGTYR